MELGNISSKRLTLKLIIYIFTFSVFFTLLQSGIDLKQEYDNKIKEINNSVKIIEDNYLLKLSLTFWSMDNTALQLELNSLIKLPGVAYLEVLEEEKSYITIGERLTHDFKEKYLNLNYNHMNSVVNMGKLYIQLSYTKVEEDIIADIISIIIKEFIKYFALTLILLFVVHQLIMRHLIHMAEFVRGFQVRNLNDPLILDKKLNKKKLDVIDDVSMAINQMRNKLLVFINQKEEVQKELKELNQTLEQKVKKRTTDLTLKTNRITDLLNNAAQGFLSFEKDFLVDDEYSVECENLLGKDLKGKDITNLLFDGKSDKIDFFKETMIDALNEENTLTSSLILSLLPSELIINKRAVSIDYKILSNNKFMMILTNITDKKKLQIKIKREQLILKMIVSIVSDSVQFYETKQNFEEFCQDSLLYINSKNTSAVNANTIHALFHTFKGLFAQLYMRDTVKRLHDFESKITDFIESKKDNNDLKNLIDSFDLINSMNEDLKIVAQTLGEKFLTEHNHIKIDEALINKLENKIVLFCSLDNKQNEECKEILNDIKKIKNKSLQYYLSIYPKLCQQLCLSLNKSIYPFEISGERGFFVPDNFKPFINSLIHVFRNSCDHGIETKECRLALQKDEIGTIHCDFKKTKDTLTIVISDDGKGLDMTSLKSKIVRNSLVSQEKLNKLSTSEIQNYIFDSNFSTNENITHISGRGVGLASVKTELDKLNGIVEVKSEVNKGTSFIFMLPMKNN